LCITLFVILIHLVYFNISSVGDIPESIV